MAINNAVAFADRSPDAPTVSVPSPRRRGLMSDVGAMYAEELLWRAADPRINAFLDVVALRYKRTLLHDPFQDLSAWVDP